MTTLMFILGIVVFAAGLLFSIAWHELGHLSTAKMFGIRVPQYMVGFGPTIWSRNKGETEYGVKAIPFGGYIRMIGMFPPGPDGRLEARSTSPWRGMIEDARSAEDEPSRRLLRERPRLRRRLRQMEEAAEAIQAVQRRVGLNRPARVQSGFVAAVFRWASGDDDWARIVTHSFASLVPGYQDWRWAVTLVRASRAKEATVSEVVMLPMAEALLAPAWVPWADRVGAGDIVPGTLMPTPDDDPRVEPGFAARDLPADADPAEWAQLRSTVAELGLGRERVRNVVAADQLPVAGRHPEHLTRLAPHVQLGCRCRPARRRRTRSWSRRL